MELDVIERLFREMLAVAGRPAFGVRVIRVSEGARVIEVEIRFLAGERYCCAEIGCHIPDSCTRLVRAAAVHGVLLPEDVEVRWRCVVEQGAWLECLEKLGKSGTSDAYEYEAVTGGPTVVKTVKSVEPPAGFTGVWVTENVPGERREVEYVDGVADGMFRVFVNGVCLREGSSKAGKYDGTMIVRNMDGEVLDVSEFRDGEGVYRIFDSEGRLSREILLGEERGGG